MIKLGRHCVVGLFVLVVQACSNSAHVPVTDIGQAPLTAKYYTVVRGDTLFSIAWRFDFDYKKLAKANGISAPYMIKPGRRIKLSQNETARIQIPNNHSKKTIRQSQKHGNPEKQENTRKAPQKGVKKSFTVKKINSGNDKGWKWPLSGKVIRQFSPWSKLSKGIDIAAKIGTPVRSSRSGQVVYAGSRLKGYGNLIIIKHDDVYLSAYAHNRTILVREGDLVKQGQQIAELGQSGTQTPKLHFEIRKQGKPINPLKFLSVK